MPKDTAKILTDISNIINDVEVLKDIAKVITNKACLIDRCVIRKMAIALLNTDQGINGVAYEILLNLMESSCICGDITRRVEATDNYFYLPENFKDTYVYPTI